LLAFPAFPAYIRAILLINRAIDATRVWCAVVGH
jgi:hypothetical protein